jgi:hypothetical protein
MIRSGGIAAALRAATRIAILAGALATLGYGGDAPRYIRAENSQFGAWLDAYQFRIMEAAATALGLLIGIQIAARLTGAAQARPRATLLALLFSALAFLPLMRICESAARLGWNANSAATAEWIARYRGYEAAIALDKVLIAGVYFLKTAAFAALAGLALAALATALPDRGAPPKVISRGPQDAS